MGIDLSVDAYQMTVPLQVGDAITKVSVAHAVSCLFDLLIVGVTIRERERFRKTSARLDPREGEARGWTKIACDAGCGAIDAPTATGSATIGLDLLRLSS
jgi:hypothetical protein